MEPTKALRDRLRKMINDVTKDGSGEGVAFSDDELNDTLSESQNIYYAASELWTLKAGLLQGDIESYSAGNEKYDLTSLIDRLEHAFFMSKKYKEQADEREGSQASVLLKFKAPEVM